MSLVEEYLRASRVKVPYALVEGETRLLDKSKYPFREGVLPLMCEVVEGGLEYRRAYISGARSIVMSFQGAWFKAKGIGTYDLAPVRYRRGVVLTYYIARDVVGSGSLIWGFLSGDEVEREVEFMVELGRAGLPVPEVVGVGRYRETLVLDFTDRREMVGYLSMLRPRELLGLYEHARSVDAYCLFCLEPSDVRVNEVLQDLAYHYSLMEEADRDARDYVRWLGSSCAYNLRLHHDYGVLHGTTRMGGGLLTNSHVANHLVGEEGTWMTDYHLARRAGGREEMMDEVNCLLHVFNPLSSYYFTEKPRALHQLAVEFMEGVLAGYKGDLFDVERELKRSMLRKAIGTRKMWKAQTYYSR